MTITYLHNGSAIDFVPATDLPLGAVVVLGAIVGIVARAIPAGALGSLCLEGVFAVPRVIGTETPRGTRLFWDAATQQVTADDAGGTHPYFGVAVSSAAATDPTIRVRLNH